VRLDYARDAISFVVSPPLTGELAAVLAGLARAGTRGRRFGSP